MQHNMKLSWSGRLSRIGATRCARWVLGLMFVGAASGVEGDGCACGRRLPSADDEISESEPMCQDTTDPRMCGGSTSADSDATSESSGGSPDETSTSTSGEVTSTGCDEDTCGPIEGFCGDGIVNGDEECDYKEPMIEGIEDGCNEDCVCSRYAFVTSDRFSGALGGIKGADQKCETAGMVLYDKLSADKVFVCDVPGTRRFKAWISTSTESSDGPSARFDENFDGRYIRPGGVLVANRAFDLFKFGPVSPITVTEKFDELTTEKMDLMNVWTNTAQTGFALEGTDHCNGWEAGDIETYGRIGTANSLKAGGWTNQEILNCDSDSRLYCFEDRELK